MLIILLGNVNVQTFFKDASKLTNFKLTQRIKIDWALNCNDWPNCWYLDYDGKQDPTRPCPK